MYPLSLFYSPGKTVKRALERPSVELAILLVVLPVIIALLFRLSLGFGVSFFGEGYALFSNIVSWILMTLIIYLVLFAVKGIGSTVKLSGIATAVGMSWLVVAVLMVVSFLFLFSLGPAVIEPVRAASAGEIPVNDALETASGALQAGQANFFVLAFFLLVGAVLMVFYLYVLYKIVHECTFFSRTRSFLVWILVLVVSSLVFTVFPGLG